MSFFTGRRSRLNSLNTSSSTSNATKSSGIVNRVSKLFSNSNKSAQDSGKGHSRLKKLGMGIIGRAPKHQDGDAARYSVYASDDSASYEPSIRRPSGLGERKESTSSDDSEMSWAEKPRHGRHSASEPSGPIASGSGQREDAELQADLEKRRKRCISSPLLLASFPPFPGVVVVNEQPLRPFPIPDHLLPVIFGHLPQWTITQVARVSVAFLTAARQVLYKEVNLAQSPRTRVHSCLDTLGRVSEAASCVNAFTCLLEKDDVEADLTLFKAMRNMTSLKSLTLSRLPIRLTGRRSRIGNVLEFQLTSLTLLETALAPEDLTALFSFLSKQPSIKSLSLPNLRLGADDPVPSNDPSVLPLLSSLVVPPPLIGLLVPTRPVTNLTINIYETLMDGLRPSSMMSSLPEARKRVAKLCLSFQETVDRRTVERVLGAVQKECCAMLDELQVRWATGSVSVLYKQISTILPRFTLLRTLRLQVPASSLLAHSPPILSAPVLSAPSSPSQASLPSLVPSRSPSVAASLSTSSSSPSLSSKKSVHSIRRKPVPKLTLHELEHLGLLSPFPSPVASTTSFAQADVGSGDAEEGTASKEHTRERALLASWAKSNAALARVEFVSGAEWVRRVCAGDTASGSRRKDKWTFVSMRRE